MVCVRVSIEDPFQGEMMGLDMPQQSIGDVVRVEPDLGSKSRTGSMTADLRVTGSATTYWTLPVVAS